MKAVPRVMTPVAGLLLGGVALLLHLFALVPVYGSLNLHFGVALALLALVLYGPGAGMLTAFVSGVSLAWVLDTPSLVPLQLLEVGIIALLVGQRLPLIIAAVAYWVVIGLPLYFVIARFGVDVPQDYLAIAVIKQGINGLLNASIASALSMALWRVPRAEDIRTPPSSLYQQVLSLALVCIFLPALMISLILSNRAVSTFAGGLELRLSQKAVDYARLMEAHLAEHRDVIALLPDVFREGDDTQLDEALKATRARYPGFLTLLRADREGRIEFGYPASFFRRLSEASEADRDVSDRIYFRRPRETGEPHVSNALQGRGFGDDPIVAVSAPLFDEGGRFAGIVEGSLDLPNFGVLETRNAADDEAIVLLDNVGQVVYASPRLELSPLSNFDPEISQRYTSVQVPQLVIGEERFLFESHVTERGWTVHALYRSDAVNALIRGDMLLLGQSLVLLIGLFVLISHFMTRRLVRPIQELTRQVRDRRKEPISLTHTGAESREMDLLAGALEEAREVTAGFQQRLSQEVDRKTVELAAANRTLEQLASEDELTGLLNRRGFYAQANTQLQLSSREGFEVALALLDVDHFKGVNDRFGHAAGDEALREVASALKRVFGRGSDVVGRTGGEEFAVLVSGGDCRTHRERVESLREQIERQRIWIDGERTISVTISIGFLCIKPTAQDSLGRMMKEADELLYESKRQGRNRTTSSTPPTGDSSEPHAEG
jgi:diguanylate cyclase (GGDEF)-like protein